MNSVLFFVLKYGSDVYFCCLTRSGVNANDDRAIENFLFAPRYHNITLSACVKKMSSNSAARGIFPRFSKIVRLDLPTAVLIGSLSKEVLLKKGFRSRRPVKSTSAFSPILLTRF